MISVLVYGRNDSYGNNLAKRAAISLNSIASVLDHADDEILFVDYNTPDDLPTFPESMADTLTPASRQRLRIFRVRPHHHRRYASFTHLPVIESVARNVALRRANPKNRWVLSTNTDMVFLIRKPHISLSAVAAGLDDGLYHIPRFEVPERMWQDFNRLDPMANFSILERWASCLVLNSVVYGYPDTIFDYAGDFQLLPLAQLQDMCGFDERMLLRGECDPNIARRMNLLGYPAQSIADKVMGYHCSHVRGKSVTRRDGSNNDIITFYLETHHSRADHQATDWGLAGEEIEERSLREDAEETASDGDSYPELVHGFLKKSGVSGPQVVPYHMSVRDVLCYTSESLSAYITDLLWELPRSRGITYLGRNAVMFQLLIRMSKQMRFDTPPVWLRDLAAQPDELSPDGLVIFDLGLEAGESEGVPVSALIRCLAPLETDFEALVRREQADGAQGNLPPRRVIFINFEFSWLYARISREFTVNLLPKASRLAYGFYLPHSIPQSTRSSTGLLRFSQEQKIRAEELLRVLVDRVRTTETIDIGSDELSYPVLCALKAALAEGKPSYHQNSLVRLHEYAKTHRLSLSFLHELHVKLRTKARKVSPSISKVCDCADWKDPFWYQWWEKICGASCAGNMFSWSGTTWLRTQVMYALHRLEMLKADLSVLLLSDQTEVLPFLLSRSGCRVDVINVYSPEKEMAALAKAATELSLTDDDVNAPAYDIVIVMGGIFDADGFESLVPRLSIVSRWLKPGGMLLYGKNILLTDQHRSRHLEGGAIASESFQRIVEGVGSLSLIGPFDFSIDKKSLDCCSGITKYHGKPSLVTGAKGALAACSLWAWKKVGTPKGWATSAVSVLNSVKGGLLAPFLLAETKHRRAEDGSVWVDQCDDGYTKLSTRWLALGAGRYMFRLSNVRGDDNSGDSSGITIVVSTKDGRELARKSCGVTSTEPDDYSIAFSLCIDDRRMWSKLKIELVFKDFFRFQIGAASLETMDLEYPDKSIK